MANYFVKKINLSSSVCYFPNNLLAINSEIIFYAKDKIIVADTSHE